MSETYEFVQWFRNSAPYINAFRGRTFVLAFGGECVLEASFANLIHDIALLHSLGVRLVLVHGARPQIDQQLKLHGIESQYHKGLRITDATALSCVKHAVGAVRVEIEALLTMGLSNSPMAGARLRVASGNFVTAKPMGVYDGIDYCHTGEVRRVDANGINTLLDQGSIVLLSPLGYSPTGEVFNLRAEDVAVGTAKALKAAKLIYLTDHSELLDPSGRLVHEMIVSEAERYLQSASGLSEATQRNLRDAIGLCRNGVERIHFVPRQVDGAVLQELFTRDGIGTLISANRFEGTRAAQIEDVGGILELIAPFERDGTMVRRSRELLEMEIDRFTVVERDGMIIGCAALYPYAQTEFAELACLAIHPDYRGAGRGDALLDYIEQQAVYQGIRRLFVLTTRTAHWFIERGFTESELAALPVEKQKLYNYQRKSKIFIKTLS
ncbi:MAG: amino-acid N-acetyltransferase [Pseudomonadota bacterium]